MLTNKYKTKLRNFKGKKHSSIPPTFKNSELSSDIQNLLNKLFYKLLHKNQKFGMRWAIGFERYIDSLNNSVSRPFKKKLRRGHVVEVELFGHFNKELTFLHPAIVLFDNGTNHILVAPISTSLFNDNNHLHIDIGIKENLKHDCAIAMDEILMIHSDRILYQHDDGKGNLVRVPNYILDKIDAIILEEFTPKFYKDFTQLNNNFTKLNTDFMNLNSEIKLKDAKINDLLTENEKLKLEIQQLNTDLKLQTSDVKI